MVFLVAFSVEHRQIVKGCLTLVTVRDDVTRLTLLTMYDWLGTPPAFATLFRQLSLSLKIMFRGWVNHQIQQQPVHLFVVFLKMKFRGWVNRKIQPQHAHPVARSFLKRAAIASPLY